MAKYLVSCAYKTSSGEWGFAKEIIDTWGGELIESDFNEFEERIKKKYAAEEACVIAVSAIGWISKFR